MGRDELILLACISAAAFMNGWIARGVLAKIREDELRRVRELSIWFDLIPEDDGNAKLDTR